MHDEQTQPGGMMETATPTTADRNHSATGTVPNVIAAAGDQAVAAYVGFLAAGPWRPNTRKLYSHHARRFFRWAGERGLTLEAIAAADVEEYAAEVVRVRSKHEASIYLTPVRGVFRSLVRSSVLAQSPFAASRPGCKRSTADELHEPPMPETLDEWQAAADAAEALLVLDSMKQYGLIEGGPDTDLDRCAELLALGRVRGITPRANAVEQFFLRLECRTVCPCR